MISAVTLRPYFGAAALACAVTTLRANDVPRSQLLYEQVVTPEVLEPAAFAFIVFLGLILIATTPRPTIIRMVVERIESWAFTCFSTIAGAIAGWGLAACVLHVVASGSTGVVPAVVIGGYAVLLTLVPLWGLETVAPIVREFTRLRFRERRGSAVIQLSGWFLTLYGLWNIWLWVAHG
jgi:hypothetical protein